VKERKDRVDDAMHATRALLKKHCRAAVLRFFMQRARSKGQVANDDQRRESISSVARLNRRYADCR